MRIPKTSSSSVRTGLHAMLAPATLLDGFDLSLFGAYRDFDTLDDELRSAIFDPPTSPLPSAELVCGHFAFSTLMHAYPHARRFTLLREPRSRLLSHWLYWRQHSDSELAPWGSWGDRVRLSRRPLADFLSNPSLACQTDNLALRMLLWPHALIPDAGFIDPTHDKRLLREAAARLYAFDFVDFIDDSTFVDRLGDWLGHPFDYRWENETRPIPDAVRSPLHRELTASAVDLLGWRSRLDFCLWDRVAAQHTPRANISALGEQIFLANLARLSILMAC
jgi:hypothetical protein